jgi:formylglycine-generating enzyme required for sulfatase activity
VALVLCAFAPPPGGPAALSAAEEETAAQGAPVNGTLDNERLKLLRTFRGEFVLLSPGKQAFPADFLMGSDAGPPAERPAHRVAIAQPFAIGRYEVTQSLWRAVMGGNPSRWTGPRNSVEMVSALDAAKFCRRATELLREAQLIGDGELVRLPTEAEWEYAARAATTTGYAFGDDPAQLGEYAWHSGNAAGNDPPVGAKKPNAWQLYDMHGYLWEWCADPWHADYSGAPRDGRAWSAGEQPGARVARQQVLRGGSWKDSAERLTCTARRAAADDLRDDAVGFRCVLAAGPKND